MQYLHTYIVQILDISISQPHTQSHTHTHTHTLSRSVSLSRTNSHIHTQTWAHTISLYFSRTHIQTHTNTPLHTQIPAKQRINLRASIHKLDCTIIQENPFVILPEHSTTFVKTSSDIFKRKICVCMYTQIFTPTTRCLQLQLQLYERTHASDGAWVYVSIHVSVWVRCTRVCVRGCVHM